MSTSSGDGTELGVFSVVEVYFTAMEEDEGKKADSAAEKRRGKWRRRWRTDITGRGVGDGHIDTRKLLLPLLLVERDEEREWREQEQWAVATAIFAPLLEKSREKGDSVRARGRGRTRMESRKRLLEVDTVEA